jgi:hypothetical protein
MSELASEFTIVAAGSAATAPVAAHAQPMIAASTEAAIRRLRVTVPPAARALSRPAGAMQTPARKTPRDA